MYVRPSDITIICRRHSKHFFFFPNGALYRYLFMAVTHIVQTDNRCVRVCIAGFQTLPNFTNTLVQSVIIARSACVCVQDRTSDFILNSDVQFFLTPRGDPLAL